MPPDPGQATVTRAGGPAPADRRSFTIRAAAVEDLATCASIWRESINDYTRRLNQVEIPDDLASILRLYGHLQRTDPAGFVVAETTGPEERRVVAFAATVKRPPLWFLSMLFVLPDVQAGGLGRALLREVMPPAGTMTRATCTDAVQPISNGLYASLGIVPRMPLLRLVGLPDRLDALASLPNGIRAVRMDHLGRADGNGGPVGGGDLDAELDAIDEEAAGFVRRQEHDFVRAEGSIGLLYVDGTGEPVGYGYASPAGRVGPVAVRDASLLAPVVADLVTRVEPRGAFGVWLPGAAGEATSALLRAGFRIDGFPCLVCWDEPFADFGRFIPVSPGLL